LSKFAIIFAIALGLAIVSTAIAGLQLVSSPTSAGVLSNAGWTASLSSNEAHPQSILGMVFQFFGAGSLALAPGSWVLVGGLWIWRQDEI
jgi:hypothetical protein